MNFFDFGSIWGNNTGGNTGGSSGGSTGGSTGGGVVAAAAALLFGLGAPDPATAEVEKAYLDLQNSTAYVANEAGDGWELQSTFGTGGSLYDDRNPTTEDGYDGATWFNTATGAIFERSAGVWSQVGTLVGPAGPVGPANGREFRSFSVAPFDDGVGQDGDTGLDRATGDLYVKTSGTWTPTGQSLRGTVGPQGASNYQLWLDAGNIGSLSDYFATLKGDPGSPGGFSFRTGNGAPNDSLGIDGDAYSDRDDRGLVYIKSAGTWIPTADYIGANQLIAGNGAPDAGTGLVGDLYIDTDNEARLYQKVTATSWVDLQRNLVGRGDPGLSAYELAVEQGFIGTLTEWLASIDGEDGRDAYDIAVAGGFVGTETDWLASMAGPEGAAGESAYEIHVRVVTAAGGTPYATEAEWIAQGLRGPKGDKGDPGDSKMTLLTVSDYGALGGDGDDDTAALVAAIAAAKAPGGGGLIYFPDVDRTYTCSGNLDGLMDVQLVGHRATIERGADTFHVGPQAVGDECTIYVSPNAPATNDGLTPATATTWERATAFVARQAHNQPGSVWTIQLSADRFTSWETFRVESSPVFAAGLTIKGTRSGGNIATVLDGQGGSAVPGFVGGISFRDRGPQSAVNLRLEDLRFEDWGSTAGGSSNVGTPINLWYNVNVTAINLEFQNVYGEAAIKVRSGQLDAKGLVIDGATNGVVVEDVYNVIGADKGSAEAGNIADGLTFRNISQNAVMARTHSAIYVTGCDFEECYRAIYVGAYGRVRHFRNRIVYSAAMAASGPEHCAYFGFQSALLSTVNTDGQRDELIGWPAGSRPTINRGLTAQGDYQLGSNLLRHREWHGPTAELTGTDWTHLATLGIDHPLQMPLHWWLSPNAQALLRLHALVPAEQEVFFALMPSYGPTAASAAAGVYQEPGAVFPPALLIAEASAGLRSDTSTRRYTVEMAVNGPAIASNGSPNSWLESSGRAISNNAELPTPRMRTTALNTDTRLADSSTDLLTYRLYARNRFAQKADASAMPPTEIYRQYSEVAF